MAAALDKASFRYAMGHFPTGVTVMTTNAGGRLHGMTVSAFASVSLEPLLILVSVERSTLMHQLVLDSRAFAINILGNRGESTARYFADNVRRFGIDWSDELPAALEMDRPYTLSAAPYAALEEITAELREVAPGVSTAAGTAAWPSCRAGRSASH